jgi:hypothetical protein
MLFCVILLAQPCSAISAQSGDPSGYPEMSREQTLPAIAHALRYYLLDADSVRNFEVCYPALKVKFRGGRPVRWTIMFSLNAKNSFGGYTGAQQMAAVFRPGRPVEIISVGMPPGLGNYGQCARIPDSEIRRLIEAE